MQIVFKEKNLLAGILKLSSLLLIWSETAHTIESFEHWGLGIAPIFSFPVSSHLQNETDLGLGLRTYIRKNERDFSAELGLETVHFEDSSYRQNAGYVLGMYRPHYMDAVDFSFGVGAGFREQNIIEDSFFLRVRGMLEKDLKSDQTIGILVDYDVTTQEPTTRDLKLLISWTYYKSDQQP